MAFPKAIEINEEGPREGFQIEKKHYPLAARAAVVDALSETGLSKIQVASFVSPKAVPTMADAAELFAAIKKKPGVTYTPLYLNAKGFERARQVSEVDMEGRIHFYTTDQFALQNNNRPAAQVRDDQIAMIDLCVEHGVPLEGAYIMTAFGCNLTGEVPLSAITDLALWTAEQCRVRQMPLPTIVLADTVGWASPDDVKRRVNAVREVLPAARIGLHLHDTRGLGIANVYAALEEGVDFFEGSVAGLGGCPFAGHGDAMGAGNVATEEVVFLAQELGIETGIDLDALIDAALLAEKTIGRSLNGRLMHGGSLSRYRGRH